MQPRLLAYAIFLSLSVLAVSCGSPEKKGAISFKPYTITDSTKSYSLQSGVKIFPVLEGPGTRPVLGSQVCLHYYGQLKDGEVFDNSWERGSPICFVIGENQVIKGLEEAIVSMRFGTKAVVQIPANMAYGNREGPANIPPNSALTFHIDLLGNF